MSLDELGPLFVTPLEATHPWLRVALFVIALPAVGMLVAGLVRGQLWVGTAWAGVVILPLLTFTLGHVVFIQDAKRVAFCGSCHVMELIVASLAADDGSLAARHFARGALPSSEACYQCHGGYGIWGGVRAKLAGMQHMLRSATGTERLPLRLYEPYDLHACLDCHAHTARFRSVELHMDLGVQAGLLSNDFGCTGTCHPAAHPLTALDGGAR